MLRAATVLLCELRAAVLKVLSVVLRHDLQVVCIHLRMLTVLSVACVCCAERKRSKNSNVGC